MIRHILGILLVSCLFLACQSSPTAVQESKNSNPVIPTPPVPKGSHSVIHVKNNQILKDWILAPKEESIKGYKDYDMLVIYDLGNPATEKNLYWLLLGYANRYPCGEQICMDRKFKEQYLIVGDPQLEGHIIELFEVAGQTTEVQQEQIEDIVCDGASLCTLFYKGSKRIQKGVLKYRLIRNQ